MGVRGAPHQPAEDLVGRFRPPAGVLCASQAAPATIEWEGRTFETVNVKAAIVNLRGEQVLRLERDLRSLPFDPTRELETVDDRHYLKLKGFDFTDGIFEVKVLSRVQQPTPFPRAQGFIGVYFRAQHDDSAFESIYLRPNCGRSPIQAMRNHSVQYFAFPGFKFADLRKEAPGLYETYADIVDIGTEGYFKDLRIISSIHPAQGGAR